MPTLEAYLRRVEISQADENETKFKKTWGPASWLMCVSICTRSLSIGRLSAVAGALIA